MSKQLLPVATIANTIHLVRGPKVILDYDLAELYGVATKVLNQAVGRNRARFPHDFMFRLKAAEADRFGSRSRSQIVTLKRRTNLKYLPSAFTEQGVAMLSSVLRSERAVKVNIVIMRAFVQLRGVLETNRELAQKFGELERRVGKHDEEIGAIVEAIRRLMAPPEKGKRGIGFHVRETPARYGTRKKR
jgi:hypothetical protein